MSDTFQVELTKEEINTVRNGLGLVLLLDSKYSMKMTLESKQWYVKVIDKFEKIDLKEGK